MLIKDAESHRLVVMNISGVLMRRPAIYAAFPARVKYYLPEAYL